MWHYTFVIHLQKSRKGYRFKIIHSQTCNVALSAPPRITVPKAVFCLKTEKAKSLFPENQTERTLSTRNFERFKVNNFNTERYRKSTIPYLQNLLNIEDLKNRKFLRSRGA